jgi:hypothetical protein
MMNPYVGLEIHPVLRYHLLKEEAMLQIMEDMPPELFDIDAAEAAYTETLEEIMNNELQYQN